MSHFYSLFYQYSYNNLIVSLITKEKIKVAGGVTMGLALFMYDLILAN